MNHEERIKAALQRYFEKQEGRTPPALRRKNKKRRKSDAKF